MKAIILFLFVLGLTLIMLSCSDQTTQPYSNTVSTPVFNLASDIYLPSQSLVISCQSPDVTIRYTMDGSVPDKDALLYTEPVILDSTQTIKAIAYKTGWNQSAIATGEYEIYHPANEDTIQLTQMTATPDSIYADGGITLSAIRVKVVDYLNFGVEGQQVSFHSSLGTITQSAVTDENGFATANLRGDLLPGTAHITATVRKYHPEHPDFVICQDSLWMDVRILAQQPVPTVHSIRIVPSGQIDLNVVNTGGVSSANLEAWLLDEEGNLVTTPHNVWFKIVTVSPPMGVNLDNHPTEDSVMAVSSGGIASITLNSGTGGGNAAVRASCQSGAEYIQNVKFNIYIHSAAPHSIEIFGGGYNTGVNIGGGLWRIVIGARLSDINDNPVDYGTSVWFALPEDVLGCQIVANAYVGNESMYGDSTAGVAYTTLTYSGVYTFENVVVRAATIGPYGIEIFGEETLILPLNQPQMEMEVTAGNLVFHGNENPVPESATVTFRPSVFDVQGNPIHNAGLEMTTECGVFEHVVNSRANQREDTIIIYTGDNGVAEINIRFFASDVPYDDPQDNHPTARVVHITISLIGTDINQDFELILLRYG